MPPLHLLKMQYWSSQDSHRHPFTKAEGLYVTAQKPDDLCIKQDSLTISWHKLLDFTEMVSFSRLISSSRGLPEREVNSHPRVVTFHSKYCWSITNRKDRVGRRTVTSGLAHQIHTAVTSPGLAFWRKLAAIPRRHSSSPERGPRGKNPSANLPGRGGSRNASPTQASRWLRLWSPLSHSPQRDPEPACPRPEHSRVPWAALPLNGCCPRLKATEFRTNSSCNNKECCCSNLTRDSSFGTWPWQWQEAGRTTTVLQKPEVQPSGFFRNLWGMVSREAKVRSW